MLEADNGRARTLLLVEPPNKEELKLFLLFLGEGRRVSNDTREVIKRKEWTFLVAYSVSRLVEALETRPVGRSDGVAGGWRHRLDRCSHKVVVLEGRER